MISKICKNESCIKLVEGRKDRLFCSKYCKTDFHYRARIASGHEFFKNKVDTALRRNRKILKKYNQKSKTTIRKTDLINEGFNPLVFTHYWKNQKGDTYLFCYDQGFKSLKDGGKDKYVLIQWQDYMNKQVFGKEV